MPVLPDVPSMIVPPGFSRPAFSASSIIRTAIRSLIEFPGLNVSIFASTVASMTPRVMRLMRTIGVLPMTSRMFPATLRTVMAKMLRDRGCAAFRLKAEVPELRESGNPYLPCLEPGSLRFSGRLRLSQSTYCFPR